MKVRVEKRFAFSAVPDALLEDKRLSLSARAVLGWMLGRPPGWKISLEHLKSVLGVSDKVWPRIRDELANAGYYQQDRQRGVSKRGKKGVWVWEHVITDAPLLSIPPIGRGGESIPPVCIDGGCRDARGGDIPDESNKENHHHPSREREDAGAPAPAAVAVVDEEEDLIEAACWAARAAGNPPRAPGAFRAAVRKRIRELGASQEDRASLVAWREHISRTSKARKTQVQAVAVTFPPRASQEVASKHLAKMREQLQRGAL